MGRWMGGEWMDDGWVAGGWLAGVMAQLDHVPLSVQDSAVIAVEVLEAREEVEARSNSQASTSCFLTSH